MFNNLLSNLIFLPLISCLIIIIFSKEYTKIVSLCCSFFIFLYSLFLWLFFDNLSYQFQFVEIYDWCPILNFNFIIGIDGISLFLILLTTLLIPICILSSFTVIKKYYKEYVILFFLLEFFLLIVFCSLDILIFYIFFESILIPMFLIIGIWGTRTRKIRSNYLFFVYTLFGSVFMLLGIIYIYTLVGTTDYQIVLSYNFSIYQQKWLWLSFFLSFSIKVPMVPFHIWLPEAHVEAPTTGSVILAGLLLKLGTYGFIRFSIPLFPYATIFYTPLIYSLALLGILYTSLIAIRQIDLKKIIAYASVAHMNLVILGLFSNNIYGLCGSVLQMLSHGLVASALFLCIGILYDRYHTRLITYYGGIIYTMPIFSSIFLFFILANIAVPGSGNFISEFLILLGILHNNIIICFFSALGIILSVIYSLWLYNRIIFGTIKIKYFNKYLDITKREYIYLLPLVILTLILGIYPHIFIISMNNTLSYLLNWIIV